MKTAIVPAQITTVEDRIAGNLSFTQMMLLIAPVLLTGVMFVLLPPFVDVAFYKMFIGITLLLMCATLAVRLRGELILNRLITHLRYNMRPKYYVFDKNDSYMRYEASGKLESQLETEAEVAEIEAYISTLVDTSELVRLQSVINDPRAEFKLKVQKGGLRVHINEIKEKRV